MLIALLLSVLPAHADYLVRLPGANLDGVKGARAVFETLRDHANKTQADALRVLQASNAKYRAFYIENLILVEDSGDKLRASLSAIPGLRFEPNARIKMVEPRLDFAPLSLTTEVPDDLKAVGADKVWDELKVRGEGIVIAGQDTGYDWRHPALIRQYRGNSSLGVSHSYSWHDSVHKKSSGKGACPPDSPEPCDDSEHGTHTMGTMVGDDGASNLIGVAPAAKWIGCRNMDHGNGTVASYMECFEFFLAPYPQGSDPRVAGRPEMAPHVINNSWGCTKEESCKGGEFLGAIRALRKAGILTVAATGNEGSSCGTAGDPPGNLSGEVLSVAAYNHRRDEIASFSSRGPSSWSGELASNLAAPGVGIRSSVPGGGYGSMSGTSMASPHAAGVVALLWSARADLKGDPDATIARLERSARPKTSTQTCGKFPGSVVPNAVYGHGFVDAYTAISGR